MTPGTEAVGRQARPLRGMVLIALAAFCFASMHAVIRHLSNDLHPFEIAFFRNLLGLIVLIPFLVRRGPTVLRTEHLRWHVARGVLQVSAMLMFFSSLTMLPLSEVSALSFTAPLFATVGAVLLLGEPPHPWRLISLATGFAGAMIIVRPGLAPFHLGSLLVLASSAAWALALLIIKRLSHSDSSLTLTAYMGLVLTPLSAIPAAFVWTWPPAHTFGWLLLMGSVGAFAQFMMAEAFTGAEIGAVLPLDFTRLVWASLLGFLVFGERPEVWTWVGGGVIFASTTYIGLRESQKAGLNSEGAS